MSALRFRGSLGGPAVLAAEPFGDRIRPAFGCFCLHHSVERCWITLDSEQKTTSECALSQVHEACASGRIPPSLGVDEHQAGTSLSSPHEGHRESGRQEELPLKLACVVHAPALRQNDPHH